jgi:hypothetical protein
MIIIAAFKRSWLINRSLQYLSATHSLLDRVFLDLLHAGLIGGAALRSSSRHGNY